MYCILPACHTPERRLRRVCSRACAICLHDDMPTELFMAYRNPNLAGYSNYLENVLKNVSTGQTYYDGINEDYNFLTTNQPNASCLTEAATSYTVSSF